MRLRDALDLCTDAHADDWIPVRGRPATTMLAGMFDPGTRDPRARPLTGDTIAVYEPDARLSLVWPVPEDDDEIERPRFSRDLPEWLEGDTFQWKQARRATAVVLLSGSPIWQTVVWMIDWGGGMRGYVGDFEPRHGGPDDEGVPTLEGWDLSAWEAGLARLLNCLALTRPTEFHSFDPTEKLVPSPSRIHPLDAARDALA